jgi:hypothetical protein
MATVTTPRLARDLVEAQQRVRHPLERIRGTIRTYVGLEGAALLLTLLGLWFWVTFFLDFFPFRLFDLDWVQETLTPRPLRAVVLGLFFLSAVVLLRLELLVRLYGKETGDILTTGFALSKKRQALPVWLRIPVLGLTVPFLGWLGGLLGGLILGDADKGAWVGLVLMPLVAFLITGAHELFLVVSPLSRWLRASVAAAGSAAGTVVGLLLGAVLSESLTTGEMISSVGVLLCAGLGAIAGDVLALVSIGIVHGLIHRKGYLVALTVPCVLAYLMGWLLAALAAAVSGWLAAAIILLLMVGPVVAVVVARLVRDFSAPTLALVLERRFPRVLGDRLITAVELADPKKAARYGYSQVMIEQTIHDAAERVGTVPVSDVFDWKRLYRYWGGAVAATLGLYLATVALFFIPWVAQTASGESAGFAAFHQTAGLVLERDLLLQNTIWPRRAFLEVLDWPLNDKREKFVGRDETALNIRVRAYKWVFASSSSAEGWRPLTWHDLEKDRRLLGEAAPAVDFRENTPDGEKDWGQPRDANVGWTLDEIEMRLNRPETHRTLDGDTHDALRAVLSKLERRAADPSMKRTLRMLTLPGQVTIRYRGERDSGKLQMDRQGDNEYTGQFPELKDKVYFTARGEDYETPRHWITVVPPPSLVSIVLDEERPAYMLYRADRQSPAVLRGMRQLLTGRGVSTGGDASRVEMPSGSNVVLNCESDKELREVTIAEPRAGAEPVKATVEPLDGRHFRVRFDDVRTPQDFYFRMVDTQGVKSERHVLIKPTEDMPPEVAIGVKVLRKKSGEYLVTPKALLPVEMKVKDDRGLHQVLYALTVTKLDREEQGSARGLLALAAAQFLPGGPGQEVAAAARIARQSRETGTAAVKSGIQRFPAPAFEIGRGEYTAPDVIQHELKTARSPKADITRQFDAENLEDKGLSSRESVEKKWFFDMSEAKNAADRGLLADNPDAEQTRYRVHLWVEAVDTDVETGKETIKDKGGDFNANRGRSTGTLAFLVVSENELLMEIAVEEDDLGGKIEDELTTLKEWQEQLNDLKRVVSGPKDDAPQFRAMGQRAELLAQQLEKSETTMGELTTSYQRILREMVVNQVDPAQITRVKKDIVGSLNTALSGRNEEGAAEDGNFPKTKAATAELRNAFADGNTQRVGAAADDTRVQLTALVNRLSAVRERIRTSLKDVPFYVEKLKAMERETARQKLVLKEIRDYIVKKGLGD